MIGTGWQATRLRILPEAAEMVAFLRIHRLLLLIFYSPCFYYSEISVRPPFRLLFVSRDPYFKGKKHHEP